jgi:hypothetical protein
MLAFLVCFVSALDLIQVVWAQGLTAAPNDVTVVAGNNAMFTCGYPTSSSSLLIWSMTSPTTNYIFTHSPPSTSLTTSNPAKYSINGSYNLIIINANPTTDAGTYNCFLQSGVSAGNHFANLVIIGKTSVFSKSS